MLRIGPIIALGLVSTVLLTSSSDDRLDNCISDIGREVSTVLDDAVQGIKGSVEAVAFFVDSSHLDNGGLDTGLSSVLGDAPSDPLTSSPSSLMLSPWEGADLWVVYLILILSSLWIAFLLFFKGEDWSRCTTEADLERRFIEPLLKSWNLPYQPQKPCPITVGSREFIHCKVDFYIYDRRSPITLFEDKLTIRNRRELMAAVDQARSYALPLRLGSYVIASKEGLRIYRFGATRDDLIDDVRPEDLTWWRKKVMRRTLLRLRDQ